MTLNDEARKQATKALADKYIPDPKAPAGKVVQLQIERELLSKEEVEEEIVRLAGIPDPSLEFDDGIAQLKANSGYKLATLKKLIDDKREELKPKSSPDAPTPDRPLATEPVVGAVLINDLIADLTKYVVVDPDEAVMAVHWVIHTYLLDHTYITPRLGIIAPDMRCGKTTFVEWLSSVVQRPKPTENVTGPAVFRKIKESRPTWLIDEFDTFLPKDDALRGILNSGHRRGVSAGRVQGSFSTFSAVAIAGIGTLPLTLHDRALCVHLQRRRRDEQITPLHLDRIDDGLARRCARWAKDNEAAFAIADPAMPYEIYNRVGDNWHPLLAIADLVGGEWPERPRRIAVNIALLAEGENLSEGEQLLMAIREVFVGVKWLTPRGLVRELNKHECYITEKALADKLARYRIKSKQQRWPDSNMEVQRRYLAQDFADAFSRYLRVPDVPDVPALGEEKVFSEPPAENLSGTSGTTNFKRRFT
jgi:hypothetical protein